MKTIIQNHSKSLIKQNVLILLQAFPNIIFIHSKVQDMLRKQQNMLIPVHMDLDILSTIFFIFVTSSRDTLSNINFLWILFLEGSRCIPNPDSGCRYWDIGLHLPIFIYFNHLNGSLISVSFLILHAHYVVKVVENVCCSTSGYFF